jgi:hypothetical protein
LQKIQPNILSLARTIPSPTFLTVRRVQSNAEAVLVSQFFTCKQWACETAGSAMSAAKPAAAAIEMRFDIRKPPLIILNACISIPISIFSLIPGVFECQRLKYELVISVIISELGREIRGMGSLPAGI